MIGLGIRRYCAAVFFVSLFVMFINSVAIAQEAGDETAIDKNKKEILRDLDLFQQSLNRTRGCISEAMTPAELERCRMDEAALKFQAIQDSLNEIGMSPEERRLYELRPQK